MREDYDEAYWENHSVTRPHNPLQLVKEFQRLIDAAPPERDVQDFLERNPWLLSEQFPHCHYILPQVSLGGQFIPDFIAPERQSGGTEWMLIEIEKPKCQLLTQKGEFAETVRIAIGQIRDWKIWLNDNQDTAKRPRLSGGLGLHDMSRMLTGYAIVGRRVDTSARYNQLRQELLTSQNIHLRTYDGIIEWAKKRAEFWQSYSPFELPSGANGVKIAPPPMPRKS